MAEGSRHALTLPPFPPLTWKQFFWVGTVRLNSWRGFQSRLGAYGSESSEDASDGTVHLSVSPPNEEGRRPPSPEQARTFQHLLENEAAIRDAVLRAIFEEYPSLQEVYGESEEMPVLERPEQLMSLIGPSIVHILATPKEGMTCVGFELGCAWDEEHGLGVRTHQGRVVEVGTADTSFSDSFAYEGDELGEGD